MKIKIQEITNTIVPKYKFIGNKNIFTLKIQDTNKYIILYSSNEIPVLPKLIFYTEIPQIQNYSRYNLYSSQTIGQTFGCQTIFGAPNYVFPSWDQQISEYSGITFGKITINDFLNLTGLANVANPNQNLSCS